MTISFASLNIGLVRQQACSGNGQRRFNAIARGVARAFQEGEVDVIGLVEVGDKVQGLPRQQADALVDTIRAHMQDTKLCVHVSAEGHPYMLLSKVESKINFTNVRVVKDFVSDRWRKAVRATYTDAGDEVDLWLVHLASGTPKLKNSIRKQMLAHLATGRPTVIAGDINTQEFVMRHWMQTNPASVPKLASSGADTVRHGDFTISSKMLMWQKVLKIGRTYEDECHRLDRTSDNHDMVCVALKRNPAATDAVELGGRPEPTEEEATEEDDSAAEAAELGVTPEIRAQAVRTASQTRERLMQADAEDADLADFQDGESASPNPRDDTSASSQSPSRWVPGPSSERPSPSPDSSPGSPLCSGGEGLSTEFLSAEVASPSQEPTIADAAELGVSSRLRDEAELALSQAQQRQLQAESDSGDSPRASIYVGNQNLPVDFLEAMQDLLWPVEPDEFDRPADLLSFESTLNPTVRMAPHRATDEVVALILALRQVGLVYRAQQPHAHESHDGPLTKEEVGVVMEFWKDKFRQQRLTRQQEEEDRKEELTNNQRRQRMRSRFTSYQSRALGNRTLGWVLITMGFNIDFGALSKAYAKEKADGNAASSPSRHLRERALAARAWLRWGRQLYNCLESGQVQWDSLSPTAQKAWKWFDKGWSAEECDKLSREYGHGMLRGGRDGGSYLGQQARGSVADRVRSIL